MYLEAYNNNELLHVAKRLEDGLQDIRDFIGDSVKYSSISQLEHMTAIYNSLFSDLLLASHFDFAITKTQKVIGFHPVENDRLNSYYHLKLLLKSPELQWLDELYGGIVSRIIKYYKALFSKIDNLFANRNPQQASQYERLIAGVNSELTQLQQILNSKEDINSEKKRLQDQYLSRIPFRSLFHITHIRNVPGILNSGIYSHTQSHNQKLLQVDISNQAINQKRERPESINFYPIHDYAPLYLNPRNPMLESLCLKRNLRNELVIIKVSPNILVNKNVLFTDGNAAEESSKFYNNLEDFNRLNWECINDEYYFEHTDGKRIKCSEVLVHEHIAIPYLNELVAYNESTFESILRQYPNHMSINLTVGKTLFY